MREIKFRAWDKETKEMFIPSKIYFDDWGQLWKIPYVTRMLYQFNFILMQYTGLKDKNGKEIYEGDIISFRTSQTQYFKGIIEWDDAHFFSSVFYEKRLPMGQRFKEHEHYWMKGNYQGYRFSNDLFDIEIIGNIYENPEFLDKK